MVQHFAKSIKPDKKPVQLFPRYLITVQKKKKKEKKRKEKRELAYVSKIVSLFFETVRVERNKISES